MITQVMHHQFQVMDHQNKEINAFMKKKNMLNLNTLQAVYNGHIIKRVSIKQQFIRQATLNQLSMSKKNMLKLNILKVHTQQKFMCPVHILMKYMKHPSLKKLK